MSAAVVGGGAEIVFGPVVGLVRSVYSLGQIVKHNFRSYENYNEWDLKEVDSTSPFATPAEVKKAYWTQFLRGLTELFLPIISAVGWLWNDTQEKVEQSDVSAKEGKAWYLRVGQMMEGPQMRKLARAEEVIEDHEKFPLVLK